jgi:opacity protein-like surface antigen
MNKRFMVLWVMLVLAVGGTTLAGEKKPSLSLGGQVVMPMGDLGDIWKTGYGGVGRFGFQVSPSFEIGGTVGYSSLSFQEDGILSAFGLDQYKAELEQLGVTMTGEGGSLSALEVLADFRYFIPVGSEGAAFKPYLTGSAGMANVSVDDLDITLVIPSYIDTTVTWPSESKTAAVFGLGAGFEYMFSPKVGFWVDGKYALSNLKLQVVLTEYDFAYLPIRAGLKIMFGGE